MTDDFEVYAEWIIRRLREIDFKNADPQTIIRWVLYSLGVKDLGYKIYLYLRKKKRATTTEIAEAFNISPTTARRYLEQLHSLGLVDYIGREYHITREDLSGSIREILLPRIKRVLNYIADIAENIDSKTYSTQPDASAEIKTILEDAKKRAIRDLENKFKNLEKMSPKDITDIISKTFDTISKVLTRSLEATNRAIIFGLGLPAPPKPPKISTIRKQKLLNAEGISITEYGGKIVYEIYDDYVFDEQALIDAKNRGKKVIIRAHGDLKFPKNINPSLAIVIDNLEVYGNLEIPKEFLTNIRRLYVYGQIIVI